jgi:6-phosphofructokinase
MNSLLLTGGGHVNFFPGLETLINEQRRAGGKILSSLDGWKGINDDKGGVVDITHHPIDELRLLGGSFIGSSRTKPKDPERVARNIRKYGIDAVFVYGGDDTQSVARDLFQQFNVPTIGWAKTMDNDTQGSYSTIGYQEAARVAAKGTRSAISTAYTHSRVVLIPLFGRDHDWVTAAAADYGHADYVITAEKKGFTLDSVVGGIKDAYERNRERYGRPFAVVVVSEGACKLEGLQPYIRGRTPPSKEVKTDSFGHPKMEPEVLALALRDAIEEQTSISSDRIAIKEYTYHLRDGEGGLLDRVFAEKTAAECVRLAREGNFGRVATVQDPDYHDPVFSQFDGRNGDSYISTHSKRLVVGSVPLSVGAAKRPLAGTGFFDYNSLQPTPMMTEYLKLLLGTKPQNPREVITKFNAANPILVN